MLQDYRGQTLEGISIPAHARPALCDHEQQRRARAYIIRHGHRIDVSIEPSAVQERDPSDEDRVKRHQGVSNGVALVQQFIRLTHFSARIRTEAKKTIGRIRVSQLRLQKDPETFVVVQKKICTGVVALAEGNRWVVAWDLHPPNIQFLKYCFDLMVLCVEVLVEPVDDPLDLGFDPAKSAHVDKRGHVAWCWLSVVGKFTRAGVEGHWVLGKIIDVYRQLQTYASALPPI